MIKKPLKEVLADGDEASSRASEISRNLGLGAIAVVWIFKNPENTHLPNLLPDKVLSLALLCAVASLGIDLLQYIFRAAGYYEFYHRKERQHEAGHLTDADIEDVHIPPYIRIGSWVFWVAKIVGVSIAYYLIGRYLLNKL